jgi:outer membrane protein OmpA-like peptidoglycan-associated protein
MHHIKYLLIVCLFVTIAIPAFSQPLSSEEFRISFFKAEKLLEDGNFQEAILLYRQLLKEQPDNANLNFKMGYCFLNTVLEKKEAISYLEKAITNMSDDAQAELHTEFRAPTDALVFLAQAYHQDYKFDKALEIIQTLKEKVPDYKTEFEVDVDLLEKNCKNGLQLMKYPVKMFVTNLGGAINSEYDEHSPVFSADEQVLIFTSKRYNGKDKAMEPDGQYFEDIYITNKLKDGNWSEPQSISSEINTAANEASIGLSVDGTKLFIYRDEGPKIGNIFYSELQGDKWSAPVKMPEPVNSRYVESHASISADDNELYFTSNRPGGFGGKDIYVVKKLPNGRWSFAQNLGPSINTQYDEEGPFIHPDGVTLFFSSKGHMSMGGFDIFFANKDDYGNWMDVTNLGYPINTPNDDVFYTPTPDGRRAYYASHKAGGIGRNDLYLITLPESEEKTLTVMTGIISLADGNPPQNCMITVTDLETGDLIGVYTPNSKTGKYLFILKSGRNYNVTVEADDFLPFSENLMVKDGTSYQEIQRPISLEPIILGQLKKEYTFYFYPNTTEMDPKHLTEIPMIAKISRILPDHGVQIILPKKMVDEKVNMIRADIITENLADRNVSESRIKVLKEPVNKEKNIIIYIAGDESLVSDNTKTKVNDSGENKKTETNDTKKTDDKTKGEENKERVLNIDGEKLPGYILFPFDKAFTREYDEILDKVAAYLVQHPELSLVLTGHTDYMGKFKYNMELSKRRADFVKKYLQKKGVKKEQMFVYYKGEKEPAAQNTSKEGRKYNRRVDMQFKDTSALNLKLESIQIPEEYRIK